MAYWLEDIPELVDQAWLGTLVNYRIANMVSTYFGAKSGSEHAQDQTKLGGQMVIVLMWSDNPQKVLKFMCNILFLILVNLFAPQR